MIYSIVLKVLNAHGDGEETFYDFGIVRYNSG